MNTNQNMQPPAPGAQPPYVPIMFDIPLPQLSYPFSPMPTAIPFAIPGSPHSMYIIPPYLPAPHNTGMTPVIIQTTPNFEVRPTMYPIQSPCFTPLTPSGSMTSPSRSRSRTPCFTPDTTPKKNQFAFPAEFPPLVEVDSSLSYSQSSESLDFSRPIIPTYEPLIEPVPTLKRMKGRQGESLLVLDNGEIFVSEDFVAKWRKRKIKKSAELCVFSSQSQNEKLCFISGSLSADNLERRVIQGKPFVRMELLRKQRLQDGKEIRQAYTKIKCLVRDCIDLGEVQFAKIDGRNVVVHVQGWLREQGVREGMVLAECLDFSGEKKQGIHLENAQSGVTYRLTFKFDFFEELQKYQGSQVYVKIQCNSCKGVLIEDWDSILWNLDMHLRCLIKSTPGSFVNGIVISSVKVLSNDALMYAFFNILEKYRCRISHYMKGGKMKSDSYNKLTVLVQMPQDKLMSEQKLIASEVMREVYDLFTPTTKDYNLKCATAEIAEVVTLTKMVCLIWVAVMMQGVSAVELCAQLVHTEEDYEKQCSTIRFLEKIAERTRDIPFQSSQYFQDESERQEFASARANEVHEKLANAWVCDLVNQPEKSEVDRQELIHGIQFLGKQIEQLISCGDPDVVQFLRELLLDGKTKQELEKDASIYNRGKAKSWMEVFKWRFNKTEKDRNLEELKKILTQTWERSQKEDTVVEKKESTSKTVKATPAFKAKKRELRDEVEHAFEAEVHSLEHTIDTKHFELREVQKNIVSNAQSPEMGAWHWEMNTLRSEIDMLVHKRNGLEFSQ